MSNTMCGAVAMPRPTGSFFSVLEDLERAASQLPATAEFSRQVANRYLGPPAEVGCCSNVVRRLLALTRRIDDAVRTIDYNLNRLSE